MDNENASHNFDNSKIFQAFPLSKIILAFVSDLIFRSRIREAAEAAGAEVQFVRNIPEGVAPKLILFDLNFKSSDIIELIRSAKSSLPEVPRICFGSHVETELFAAAEAAGASEVYARSQFVQELPELLRARD